MKIAVQGLWHLGTVTAACLAGTGFDVVGIDQDTKTVTALSRGIPPLYEPGLENLVKTGLNTGKLSFTTDFSAVSGCDLVWIAYDTPVDEEDNANVRFVTERIERLFEYLKDGTTILISSQVPVGTTRNIADSFASVSVGRTVHFAYSPENLRLGQSIKAFTGAERIVVGVLDDRSESVLQSVLGQLCDELLWMKAESAEMVKHALNAFLATSVTFANEVATLCEFSGADAAEVERGLRSEPRVGSRAYIRAGGAFAGGTLARDVNFLNGLAAEKGCKAPLLGSIIGSNAEHRAWPFRQICSRMTPGNGPVAVLGLSYKPDTDSTRRSIAIELCRHLLLAGYAVIAADPVVRSLPPDLATRIEIRPSAIDALTGAAAGVIATGWPEFRTLDSQAVRTVMQRPLILDQTGFLVSSLDVTGIEYVTVGRSR